MNRTTVRRVSRTMRLLRVVPVLLVLLATSCGGSSDAIGSNGEPSATADPAELVGRWFVSGPEVPAGTILKLGDELTLFQACGVMGGEWRADAGQRLFVAVAPSSGDEGCFRPTAVEVPWLDAARSFGVRGEGRVLLDGAGAVVATLAPGAQPTVGPNRVADDAAPPTLSPERRAAFAEPAPLPEGVLAPSAAELAGEWVPTEAAPSREPYVRFDDATRRWSGSDGCNGSGGAYALGAEGRLLATQGFSTLVGCDNSPVTEWVPAAARVGLVAERLRFYDRTGAVLGTVVRPATTRTAVSPPA